MKEDIELDHTDAKRLAVAVEKIDKAMKEIMVSGLSRKAIVALLHDSTQVSKRDINSVIDGLESLGALYLERVKK